MALIDLMKLSQALLVPCKMLERNIAAFTIRKHGNEQTQLFIVPPYTFVPDHTHPNVNVRIKVLSGKTELRKAGRKLMDYGVESDRIYNIEAGEPHGFSTFDQPVVFVAMETWLNGVSPDSVEKDWVGEPL